MREIPIVFPVSLAIIVLLLLFTSAYAISSDAVANERMYGASLTPGGFGGNSEQAPDRQWFQKAAFVVCPLH